MADAMQGIEQDVPFDFGAAQALISACDTAAGQVDAQRGSRRSWVTTASAEFKGHFAELFTANGLTADGDAGELSAALRTTSTAIGKLVTDAKAEQKRRQDARDWKHEHDNRSTLDKVGDFLGGGDDCPIPEPSPTMSFTPDQPRPRPRQNPAPGSGGGGGGGTSSARPSDLHTFASNSRSANDHLTGQASSLRAKNSAFVARCRWGTLDAEGVFSGFSQWLAANENDARWAQVVGDAFAQAGGEGAVSTLPDSAIHAALQSAGVDESRTDLTIAMPAAYGHPPTTGYANDPVNTATGNFVETETDLEFPDATDGLWWRRTYNSINDAAGVVGPGWSTWAESGLAFTDEAAHATMPDGRVITFPRLGDGWDRATDENLWLDQADDGTLVVSTNDGTRTTYAGTGHLLSHGSGAGTTVTLSWRDDRLVALHHERGRSIALEHDDDGRLLAVAADDGRRVTYDYDDAGHLVAATGPLGTRRYEWNEQGLVSAVVDADGVVEAANEYDEKRRVVRQRSPFGRVTRFAYLPGRVTVVSDDDGTRANTWIADPRGRLVGVIDAHDHRQSMSYDSHGNKVVVTDRDGASTVTEHDARGRRVRQVDALGADVTWAYDDLDRVTRVEVTSGDPTDDRAHDQVGEQRAVVEYEYDGEQRHPSVVRDPEGGVTTMVWRDGLMTEVVDPVGVALRIEHDEHGELVATTDAAGNTARLERDATGRVVAAVTPSGRRTTYAYGDAHGMLAERVDPDGSVWRYEYTTAGRLAVVVDPTGGRTEMEYGPDGEEAATIDPLGRAMRRRYDDLGHLAGAELPDGSRWEFAHDALGRLTGSVDPEGGVRRTEFDPDGAPSAATDPTGVRRELRDVAVGVGAGAATELVIGDDSVRVDIDQLGRLVSQTQADGSTRLVRHDRCGRPVEIVDPVGGLTRLVRDVAGRVVTLVRPSGAEIGYTYDACGRLATITDATGATSTRVYDADGHVVEQHLPTGEVATTRFDPCGRVVALRVPGSGTTSYVYDAAGRVVETRDPSSGRRRFRYDAAGQLVAAVDANGGVTGYDYDLNGRCVAITHPDGGVTRRRYDANNHVVAETDPLGRTTTAAYDAAGRQVAQTDPAGSRTEWRHDDRGQLASVWIDGVQHSDIERDPARRRVRVTDRSGPGGAVAVHELEWDARGLLVSRTREARGVRWEYDADGGCTALVAPDGVRTDYARDAVGRLVGVAHPRLGQVVIERDAAGRMSSARAGGTTRRWSYTDGFLTGHEVTGRDGSVEATRLTRDDDGRIREVATGDQTTAYTYDEACQLVAAVTTTASGSETARWRYDAAGRLVEESQAGVRRTLVHDLAGQLTATRVHGEDVVTYTYDPVGRRVGERYADGSSRELSWSRAGWLAAISTTDRLGDTSRTDLVVDALGELARVDGVEVFSDTSNPWNGLLSVGEQQITHAGPFTAVSRGAGDAVETAWAEPGWRDARATGADPWSLPTDGLPAPVGPSTGFEVTPDGGLLLGGLEWLGSRVYDPDTRAFLSVDPLEPTTAAGWAGNPYSYAGNDPLHALDPLGLHPVTDAELRAYNANNGGVIAGAGAWLKNNWEYVAAGAMVIGGAALMFVPGGQAFGMGLISAGIDTGIQKATTGHVNWGEVAISGALGMVGGVGSGAAAKMGMTGYKAAMAAGAIDGAWQGAAAGGGGYLLGPGPHSVDGFLTASASGTVTGAAGGAAGGALTHGIGSHLPGRNLGDVEPTPALPAAPERLALPPGQSATRPDFVVGSNGTVIPTSRTRLEGGFNDAGFPSSPTHSPGTEYTMPDGSRVRVMEASGQAPTRASFTNANGQPVDAFTGKPPQPPPGGTSADNKAFVRGRSHIELGP